MFRAPVPDDRYPLDRSFRQSDHTLPFRTATDRSWLRIWGDVLACSVSRGCCGQSTVRSSVPGGWGFPFAVMRKFRDDHGGALTTVIAYNAFFALFPLLLVVVTVLGFLLGRDSGFQQRLLRSTVADFPIIGDQVQDNIHGLRGSGVGLVIGLVAFAWGARGLTQVAQHAMAEIWNIPGRQRPGFWARQVRGLLLVVFAVGLAATSLLTWLGSYGGKAVAVALANLAAGVAWQALQAVGGYLVDHYLRHTSQVYGVFAIVLGLLFWLYLAARLTLYAAELNVIAARQLWPRSVLQPSDLAAPQPPTSGQHRDVAGDDTPTGL
jgi:uncharacterized BrkB/YihY/UPF0761 family membrane protein